MVQRANITLPDDLHQRLQAFKDNLNVSAVCQEALERVVTLEEAKAKAMSRQEEAIARLKVQAKNQLDEWYQEGKKDGLEESPDWDYSDFVTVSDWVDSGEDISDLPYKNGDFNWLIGIAANSGCPERFHPRYFTGFLEGALEFWNDIKDKVETELS